MTEEIRVKWGDKLERLTERVIGCAMKVHSTLGPGYLEKVYERAMVIELTENGIACEAQAPLTVYYHDQVVGEYFADILVENILIVELKALRSLMPRHELRLVNYLTSTSFDIGLLINFGEDSLAFKKKFRLYKPKEVPSIELSPEEESAFSSHREL